MRCWRRLPDVSLGFVLVASLTSLTSLTIGGCRNDTHDQAAPSASASASEDPSFGGRNWPKNEADDEEDGEPAPRRKPRPPPTGAPPRLSCADARTLVDDVLARLAAAPTPLATKDDAKLTVNLADATLDWADPHGLWTASPDSPVAIVVRARAAKLRAVVEGKADCAAELAPMGASMKAWITELRSVYDASLTASAKGAQKKALGEATGEAAFEDGPVTQPARKLAAELGRRLGIAGALVPEVATDVALARDRWLPNLDEAAWGEVLLAAAVRAYVPMIDPHGAWAPAEEASILFDRDLELSPPARLWGSAPRTVLGVRIDESPAAPLHERDVVLAVDGVALAGLSAEAIDQLAETPEGAEVVPRKVTVLRKQKVVDLEVASSVSDEGASIVESSLPVDEIPFGDERVLVLHIADIPDALGDDVARVLSRAKLEGNVAGVVLDLRGNGGGSIEGATSTLGVFLAGAPLFPLKHRDGAIEIERAGEPPIEDRFTGPVATLVDAGTASAAEMIAGALHAYRRGAIVGTKTYGKGCAQEYVDDVTGLGVLRITTLLFALPDGTAIQRIGLVPDVPMPFPAPQGLKEHEVDLLNAPPSWTGPDERDPKRIVEVPWPVVTHVGPCKDESVCQALRRLAVRPKVAKK